MAACKRIREVIADDYDRASDRGISKKLLKSIVKERGLLRKIASLTEQLESDERSEREMLLDKKALKLLETPSYITDLVDLRS